MNRTTYVRLGAASVMAIGLATSACSGQKDETPVQNQNAQGEEASVKIPNTYDDPLPSEPMLVIEDMKGEVDRNWVYAHDLNFNTLALGRIQIYDIESENRNFRGQLNAGQFASFTQAPQRSELLVAETHYSRGVRGVRTDTLSIYNMETLELLKEIVLPNNNRGMNVPQKGNLRVSENGKFVFIYTFTPASGVIVVDLETREIKSEVPVPGCTMIYTSGPQGFAMQCSDGSMIAFEIDEDGNAGPEVLSDVFHDIDADPMFLKSARIGDVEYWPTFTGALQGVRLNGGVPVPTDFWRFGENEDWKPSGWQIISSDSNGLVYVLMRAGAKEGDHKIGGQQVWILDPLKQAIVDKIELVGEALSIEITKAENPYLVVTSAEMTIDVYDLKSKSRVRSIGGFMSSTPFLLHASEAG